MRKRAINQILKRITALTGAFVMAISVTSYASCGGAYRGKPGAAGLFSDMDLPSGMPYPERDYERYSPAVLEQAMAEFEAACAGAGQDGEVVRLYDMLISEYDRLSTLAYMAQIAYDRDISDPAAVEEQTYTTDLYMEMGEKITSSIQKGLASSYGDLLRERIGGEQAAVLEYYEPYTEEEQSLIKEEDRIIRQYEVLAAEETSVVIDGGTWTYDRLESDEALTLEAYEEIQEALSRERNGKLGGCLLELADVRRRIAVLYGYDSYSEYVYQIRYGRDYTLEDVARLSEVVKKELVPLYDELWGAEIDYDAYEELDKLEERSTEELLEDVEAGIGRVDEELGDIFRYMRENQLYDIQGDEPGKDRVESNYTVRFASYGDGYIFINRENTFRDYQAVVHEFGHFCAYYYDKVPELYSVFGVDVMEIHSMGLELLAANYAEDMAGAGGAAYAHETVTDMLFNVISACMFNEFEVMLYENPDMGLEDLNRKFKEIQDSYGDLYYHVYGDLCYDWVDVPHVFYDPLYYIGYGTASLTVLDLWILSREDMDGAVSTYKGILETMDAPYRETADRWGLVDIFDETQVVLLADEVREYYGLNEGTDPAGEESYREYEIVTEEPGLSERNNGAVTIGIIVLGGIGIIMILQLALLGMGGVVIWLLVKDRGRGGRKG